MAERTGCPVLFSLWSYVTVVAVVRLINHIAYCFVNNAIVKRQRLENRYEVHEERKRAWF
jgi:hypothetical protein